MAPKVPISSKSQLLPSEPLKIGATFSVLSAYSPSNETAPVSLSSSNGRTVFRLTVPPNAPSIISAVGDLTTSTVFKKLDG